MADQSITEVLHMGGYGGYVWSCYALTALALLWLALGMQRRWRRELQQARRRAQSVSSAPQS